MESGCPCDCSQLGHESGAAYCYACGSQLSRKCHVCGSSTSKMEARFCFCCGTKYGTTRSVPETLVDQVTINFSKTNLATFAEDFKKVETSHEYICERVEDLLEKAKLRVQYLKEVRAPQVYMQLVFLTLFFRTKFEKLVNISRN